MNAPFPSRLHRAIVALPAALCERDRPLQERIVFFEALSQATCAHALEALLAAAWCVDTTDWCERGYIYNITSAVEKLDYAVGEATGDLRLFETGCGGDGDYAVGPDRIHYACSADVDLFVTPRMATRLRTALAAIDALFAAEPARRGAIRELP